MPLRSHPVWSPDGKWLAWASSPKAWGAAVFTFGIGQERPGILDWRWELARMECSGDQIITTLAAPNETYLTVYSVDGTAAPASDSFSRRGAARTHLGKPGHAR